MSDTQIKVLIVEDDIDQSDALAEWLQRSEGAIADTAATGEKALDLIRDAEKEYDVVFLDQVFPDGMNGIQTLRKIKEITPSIPVIMFTGKAEEAGDEALQEGAYRYIMKPYNNIEIAMLLRNIRGIQQWERRRAKENELLKTTRRLTQHTLSKSKEKLFQEVVKSGSDLLDAPVCIAWELDKDKKFFNIVAHEGKVDAAYQKIQIDIQSDAVKEFFKQGKPLTLIDIQKASSFGHKEEAKERNWISLLTAPMIDRGKVTGILDVYTYQQRTFAQWEKEFLATFAAQAAMAIRQSNLFGHLQEISRLSLKGDFDNLAEYVVGAAGSCTRSEVILWMMSEEADERDKFLRINAHQGDFDSEYVKTAKTPTAPDESITGRALKEKEPIYRLDIQNDSEEPGFHNIREAKKRGWHSFMAVPLLGEEGRPLGSLSLYSEEIGKFGQPDADLMRTFANQVAIAFEEVQRQKKLEHLTKIGRIALRESGSDLGYLLGQLAAIARKITGANYVCIFPYQHRRLLFYDNESIVISGLDERPDFIIEKPREQGLTAIIRDINEIVVYDVKKQKLAEDSQKRLKKENIDIDATITRIEEAHFLEKKEIESFAGLSLKAGSSDEEDGQIEVGMLYIDFCRPHQFTEEELQWIRVFGHQIGNVIHNAHLREEAKRHSAGHKTLNDIGAELMGLLDEDEILDEVARSVSEAIDCSHCSIFRLEANKLVVNVTYGQFAKAIQLQAGRTFEIGQGVAGWVAEKGSPALVPNTLDEDRFDSGWSGDENPLSLLVVPIILGQEQGVYGVISVEHDQVNVYDKQDQQLLEILARQAGIAIQNANRLRLVQRLAKVGESISALGPIKETLQQIAEQALDVLRADLVDIYCYDSNEAKFELPPIMAGERKFPELIPQQITPDDVVVMIIDSGKSLFTSNAQSDSILTAEWGGPKEQRPEKRFVIREEIQSTAGIPLIIEGKKLGVLFVSYRQKQNFAEKLGIREGCEVFAHQAEIAIENARLYEQRGQDIASLGEINKAILSKPLDEITQLIADKTLELAKADYCVLRLLDESGNLVPEAFAPEDPPEREIRRDPLPVKKNSFTGWVASEEKAAFIGDVSQAEHYLEWYEEVKSCMAAPLMYQDKLVGTLYVESTHLNAFSEERQLNLMQSFANQAAIAIENARLYEQIKEQQETQIQAIEEISTSIADPQNFQQVLEGILEWTLTLMKDSSFCEVRLYDEQENILEAVASAGEVIEKNIQLPIGKGITGWVAEQVLQGKKEVFIEYVPDVKKDKKNRYVKTLGATRSEIAVPLLDKDNGLIGVLNIEHSNVDAFDQNDCKLAGVLANLATVAIENTRAFQELEARATRLEKLQEVTTSISAQTHSRKSILQQITESIIEIFPNAFCYTRLYDKNTDEFFELVVAGISKEQVSSPRARGTSRHLLKTKQPRYIENASADSGDGGPQIRSKLKKLGVKSIAQLPLVFEDEMIGILNLGLMSVHKFSPNDKQMLELFAHQAAIAIENACLFEQINRKLQEQHAVNQVGQKLTASIALNEKQITTLIYEQASALMHTDNLYVALYEQSTDMVRFPLMFVDGEPDYVEPRRDGKGRTEYIIHTKKPLLIKTKTESDAWYKAPKRKEYIGESFASWLGVPMTIGDQVIGVIATYHKTDDFVYDEDNQEILQAIASQAAIALQNVSYVDELEAFQDLAEDFSTGSFLGAE